MIETPLSTSGESARAVAHSAALHGGRVLMEHLDRVKSVSFKGRGNIVTDVDVLVEGEILALLRREFPNMGILAEESAGVRADAGYVWIVDPLDGTRNYASGIPFFSTVVGLALDGEVLVEFTVELTDTQGSAITSVAAGDQFLVRVLVEDKRSPPDGVFAAYTDVTFDTSLRA